MTPACPLEAAETPVVPEVRWDVVGVGDRARPSGSVAALMVGGKGALRGRTRGTGVLVALGLAAAVLVVDAAQALAANHAGTARPAPASSPVISPNWSGYLVTGRPGARV